MFILFRTNSTAVTIMNSVINKDNASSELDISKQIDFLGLSNVNFILKQYLANQCGVVEELLMRIYMFQTDWEKPKP